MEAYSDIADVANVLESQKQTILDLVKESETKEILLQEQDEEIQHLESKIKTLEEKTTGEKMALNKHLDQVTNDKLQLEEMNDWYSKRNQVQQHQITGLKTELARSRLKNDEFSEEAVFYKEQFNVTISKLREAQHIDSEKEQALQDAKAELQKAEATREQESKEYEERIQFIADKLKRAEETREENSKEYEENIKSVSSELKKSEKMVASLQKQNEVGRNNTLESNLNSTKKKTREE